MLAAAPAVAAAVAVTAACGSDDDNEATPDAAATTISSTETPAATNGEESSEPGVRTVSTMHGEVEVPADPQRVVLLGYDTTGAEVMSVLGVPVLGVDGISGLHDNRPEIELTGELNDLGDSGEMDVEAVAALEPDLVTGLFRSSYEDTVPLLENICPVAVLDGEDSLEWRVITRGLADIVNRGDEAEVLISETEERIEALKEELDTSRSVLIVRPNADGSVRVFAAESFPGLVLAELGIPTPEEFREVQGEASGTAAARGWTTLSPERLNELDVSDYIIAWAYGSDPEALFDAALRESAVWNLLPAVQEGNVYFGGKGWYGAGLISVNQCLDDIEAALG